MLGVVLVALTAAACCTPGSAPPSSAPPSPSGPAAPLLPAITPPMPDLSHYASVSPGDFPVTDAEGGYVHRVYFRTPDGLTCSLSDGTAECDGALHGTPAPANVVTLNGFSQTSKPAMGPPGGVTPEVLPVGHKVVYKDVQCGVAAGAVTSCSTGSPATRWFVLSPNGSGIGPRTEGLPAGFPDPKDFVSDDQSYIVGEGARNMFPVFTVKSGLTCKIMIFSGSQIGCDGPLPTAPHGENEIFVKWMGGSVDKGMTKAGSPGFATPMYPGDIRQLPPQHRVDESYENGGTCLATADGGVACFVGRSGPNAQMHGFVATPTAAWTF